MAPGFQSSFIPKNPIDTQQVFESKKIGVVGVLVISLFICSIILSIAVAVYKNMLKSDIANLQTELITAGDKIDKKTIKEMVQFSQKLDIVRSIVFKHRVISGFLSSLASSTVISVSFTDFNYNDLVSGSPIVTMKGQTNSYASVAQQESVFAKNKYWKQVSFSNLNLTNKGVVTFDMSVTLDPQISIYAPSQSAVLSNPVTSPDTISDLRAEADAIDNLEDIDSKINNL